MTRAPALALAVACLPGCFALDAQQDDPADEGDATPDGPHGPVAGADAGGGPQEPPPDALGRRCDPARPFSPDVVRLSINSPAIDAGLRLSADELTGYFYSNRGDLTTRIYRTTRPDRDAPFGEPVVLDDFGPPTSPAPFSPAISSDGLELVVTAMSSSGSWDIHLASRASVAAPFGPLTRVANVNAPADDLFPLFSADGGSLYFKSSRSGFGDLYVAARVPGGFGPASPVPLPNADRFGEYNLALSPDERTIIYSRFDDATGLDMFEATRPNRDASFGQATELGQLDSAVDDSPSWLTADGCFLYFTSSREGGISDLFVASRSP